MHSTRNFGSDNIVSSHSRYCIPQPIRIEYFKHVTELINSRPLSVQDFLGVSNTCKTITKSLRNIPSSCRTHEKSRFNQFYSDVIPSVTVGTCVTSY